jgi:hypothetical protein
MWKLKPNSQSSRPGTAPGGISARCTVTQSINLQENNMQLKDFIKESLTQIIEGIAETQKTELPHYAEISPHIPIENFKGDGPRMKPLYSHQYATPVKFDIAVTAEETTGTKGGIGVVAGIFALGSQGKTDNKDSSISRIQFEIPIILPHWKPQNQKKNVRDDPSQENPDKNKE